MLPIDFNTSSKTDDIYYEIISYETHTKYILNIYTNVGQQ